MQFETNANFNKFTVKLLTYMYLLVVILTSLTLFINYMFLKNPFYSLGFYAFMVLVFFSFLILIQRWFLYTKILADHSEKYVKENRYKEAKNMIEKALKSKFIKHSNYQKKRLLNMKSLLCLKEGNYKKGVHISNFLVHKYPQIWDIWYLKGLHEYNLGKIEKSLQSFEHAYNVFKNKYNRYNSDKLSNTFKGYLIEEEDFKPPIIESEEWKRSDYAWSK